MQFDYPNAPMHYEEGIPAHKAGEWFGKKPCKFMPTRRIIHPVDHGIIFGCNFFKINDKFVFNFFHL